MHVRLKKKQSKKRKEMDWNRLLDNNDGRGAREC